MEKLRNLRKWVFVAIASLGIALAVSAPSQALAMGEHGSGDGYPRSVDMQHGSDGRHGVDGHHDVGRGHDRFRFGIGVPVYPYYYGYYPYGYYPPAYGYAAPTYWYWCPSYGAYYPNVTSCPEAWQPVPAS